MWVDNIEHLCYYYQTFPLEGISLPENNARNSEVDMEQQSFALPAHELHDFPSELYVPLTRREREVLVLIAAGQTNREMAERLVVSPETVKTHVRHVLGKLGASRKTEIRARIHNAKYQ
jgi:DNA-binding NarL/FixJ family response regulator